LFNVGRFEPALRIYESLREELAGSAVLHYKLARCHHALEQPELARAAVRTAVKLEPDLLPALVLGAALTASIDPEEAAILAQRAAGHADVAGDDFCDLLRAMQAAAHTELARTLVSQARARFGRDPQVLTTAAEFGLAQKDLPLAESCYRTLAELNPRDPTALENLGRVLQFQARTREAAAVFERALRVQPSNLAVRAELIALMEAAGAADEDVALQRRYLEYYQRVHAALGQRAPASAPSRRPAPAPPAPGGNQP